MIRLSFAAIVLALGTAWAAEPMTPCTPCKVCVCEPKTNNTKKVYTVKNEEYCLRKCSRWPLFGHYDCDCSCGELRIRRRLVIKKVLDCDTVQCVPK